MIRHSAQMWSSPIGEVDLDAEGMVELVVTTYRHRQVEEGAEQDL